MVIKWLKINRKVKKWKQFQKKAQISKNQKRSKS